MESRSSRGEAFTMIDLYYWTTPNGHKITLFLEEAGLPYTIHPVDLAEGTSSSRNFWRFRPIIAFRQSLTKTPATAAPRCRFSNRAPSSSISPKKTSKFLPMDLRGRIAALEWLFWQVGGLGPMAGQESIISNNMRPKSLAMRSNVM